MRSDPIGVARPRRADTNRDYYHRDSYPPGHAGRVQTLSAPVAVHRIVRVLKLIRFRDKIRQLTKRTRHGKLEQVIQEVNQYTMGWIGYFRLSDARSVFEELDGWLRRRFRQLVWKRWKRGKTRWRELVKLGVPARMAGLGAVQHGPWRMAASPVVTMALGNACWRKQGLRSITERYHQLRGT